MKRLTVNQRLAKRLTADTKNKIIDEWADQKAHEIQKIKDRLEYAWQNQDVHEYQLALDQLLSHKLKAMSAVKGIAKNLIYSEYKPDDEW